MRFVAAVAFMLLLSYSIIGRFAAYRILVRRLGSASFMLSNTFLYVELLYLRHRRQIGSRSLDILFASLLPAFLLAVYFAILESRIG